MALSNLPTFSAGILSLPHSDSQNRYFLSHLYPKPQTSAKPFIKPFEPLLHLYIVASPNPTLSSRPPPTLPCASSKESSSEESLGDLQEPDTLPLHSNRLLRRAIFVGAATVASKILGLVREIVLAAVIGVGPVATAFNYAAVLPRFSTSFLGGVNGPIHVTVVTTLSKLSKEKRKQLSQKIHFLMLLIGSALASFTFIYPDEIISLCAPGLKVSQESKLIREMAQTQLKIMTPCILLAGSVGVGFGCLTADGDNIIPSLSPSMTSISIIASCILCLLIRGSNILRLNAPLAGIFVSIGASIGTILQWAIQILINGKPERKSNFSWKDFSKDKDVHKLFSLLIPATLSSSLVQIASLTDLYFSSFVPGAAACLSYAHLLANASLGILSSIIILPMLPDLSRLAKPSLKVSRKKNLRKAILLCMVIILPVTSNFCVLAGPIVEVLFQRLMFDSYASSLVSSVLICYLIGSPFWIIRELLATIFYSLGESKWLILINVTGILLNGILDWLSVCVLGVGAEGLALSTSCVTALSAVALFLILSKKLRGIINVREMGYSLLLLLASCSISGLITMLSYKMLQSFLSAISIFRFCRLLELVSISLAGLLGMSSFYLSLVFIKSPEVVLVNDLVRTLISRNNLFGD
ncbi:uncharacterized protein [Typha latifolia]|uniref:uncharacterized protein isoform X1 n=1 Tax=Typha latifolia TaxID=4733 RepID=UPI003C2E385B